MKTFAKRDLQGSLFLSECEDMFGICDRIKNVNQNYVLFFNHQTKKYEIHDSSNCFCSLCLVIEPKDLNETIIEKLYKTRRENMKKYFMEIDLENQKIQEEVAKKSLEKSHDALSEVLSFASRSNHELSQNEMKNIISNLGD